MGDPGEARLSGALSASPRNRLVDFSAQQDRLQTTPLTSAAVQRTGPDPLRILMLGGGLLEGRGLRDHNLGLPGQVADQIVRSSGRGVDLDVVVEPDPTGRRAVAALPDLRLRQYSDVLLMLGERHALTGTWTKQWEPQIDALLAAVATMTPAGILVVDTARAVVEVSTAGWRGHVATANAERLAAVTAGRCARDTRVTYVELAPARSAVVLRGRFADADYESWAARLVTELLPDPNGSPERANRS